MGQPSPLAMTLILSVISEASGLVSGSIFWDTPRWFISIGNRRELSPQNWCNVAWKEKLSLTATAIVDARSTNMGVISSVYTWQVYTSYLKRCYVFNKLMGSLLLLEYLLSKVPRVSSLEGDAKGIETWNSLLMEQIIWKISLSSHPTCFFNTSFYLHPLYQLSFSLFIMKTQQ